MTREKWQGHIAILMTNVIFGLNTPIAKTLVPEWIHPFALTLVRMSCATLIFWSISLFLPREKVSFKDLTILFFAALFGLIGAQLSFAVALQYSSPVNISLIAAMTPVPVIGVPINASLDGMDALLAIAQMPPGIPVATTAINGAMNAGILAAQILAVGDNALKAKIVDFKESLKKKIVDANNELAKVKYDYKTN